MGKINASDKIMFLNQIKKRKYGNKKIFYINHDLTDSLDLEFTTY